jgi:hypothetical protein
LTIINGYNLYLAFAKSPTNATVVPYCDVIDLIKFPERPDWIRIGYFRPEAAPIGFGAKKTA